MKNPLGYMPVGKLLIQFAVPSIISMLVNALYNIVDQIFIGQKIGYLGNAATTIAFPIVTIMLAISTLFGAGGSAYAAIKLGEKNEEEANKTLGNVFVLLTVFGVVIMVLGFLFLDPLLYAFGARENTIDYARTYTIIILLGAPFSMIGVGLSNLVRTDGNPNLAMYSILAGAALNTILDPIYLFVFNWGVAGAAIATTTSQIISAVILIYYFAKKGNMRFRKRDMKLDARLCRRISTIGISSCILQMASTLLQVIMNNSLVYYGNLSTVTGDAALSAMGIVMKINMILISFCVGIGIGAQPILGFNQGAQQPHRIRKTYLLAASSATAIAVVGWLCCLIFPNAILALFGTDDANFTMFAVKCMRIFLFGIFTAGFQIVSTSYFQATGQPIKASILSSLRQIVFLIPMILILPLFFELDGILYAGACADFLSALVVLIFVIHEMKSLNSWVHREGLHEAEA